MTKVFNLAELDNLILKHVKIKEEVFFEFLEEHPEIFEQFALELKEAVKGHVPTEYPHLTWKTLKNVFSRNVKEHFKDATSVKIERKGKYYDRYLVVKTKCGESYATFILGCLQLNVNLNYDKEIETYSVDFKSEGKVVKTVSVDLPYPKIKHTYVKE